MKVKELLEIVNSNLKVWFVDEIFREIGIYNKPADVPPEILERNVTYIQPEWRAGVLRIELEEKKDE